MAASDYIEADERVVGLISDNSRLRAALKEAGDELKIAEERFARSGYDSAAARMNIAVRNIKEALRA